MGRDVLKAIPKIKLSKDSLMISCNAGSIGTTMDFLTEDVNEVIGYFRKYGIKLENVGSGGSSDGKGNSENYTRLQFPTFTNVYIEKYYTILSVPDDGGKAVMVRLILK